MDDPKFAHLSMIQGVINRLSQNSFLLKGWSVILLAGLFGLAANDSEQKFVYIAYFPTAAFWLLDADFLRQERLFRGLYDEVRVSSSDALDFAMDTTQVPVDSVPRVALSRTLVSFYGAILLTTVGVTIAIGAN